MQRFSLYRETYKPTLSYIKNFPSTYSPLQASNQIFKMNHRQFFTCICKYRILSASYNYIPIIVKHFFLPSQFYTFGFKLFFFHVQRFSHYRAKYKPNLFPGFTKQEWCNTLFSQRSKLANQYYNICLFKLESLSTFFLYFLPLCTPLLQIDHLIYTTKINFPPK